MCLYPALIRNRKYVKNKKNGGVIPPYNDARVLMVPIGCTRCIECLKQKSREWRVRLSEDIKVNKNARFVTLTFSNEEIAKLKAEAGDIEGYELDNWMAKTAVRRFLERWRKESKKSVRHWLITELGQKNTENVHIHGLIWTDKPEKIKEKWTYGFTWVGDYVNERTINYISKYVTKLDGKHKHYTPKILTSAGIGRGYEKTPSARVNRFKGKETRETYTTRQGIKLALPIYYRNKIYSEEEREKLWIQRLDKNERWVCGEKIKADDFEKYIKIVRYHRKRSERLGYGSNKIEWQQEEYEKARRKLLMKKRIEGYTVPKILTSAGIGRGYEKTPSARVNRFKGKETRETYTTRQGIKLALPIYYRNKIYSEEEREKLWIQRLDKNERWVCGEKIKADDFEKYIKIVRYHRKRSERLGYGSNKIEWQQEEYEKARRKLLMKKRIEGYTVEKYDAARRQFEAYANATADDEERLMNSLRRGFSKRTMDIIEDDWTHWKPGDTPVWKRKAENKFGKPNNNSIFD